ncbi:hypothetical protein WR25_09112 [Diploscapter pachys]|uniref:Transmembrane protein 177 n=1 Tax=Diploscapter pachys TaxID=2018661 RepID=A0A2A2LPD8_9BILA|nr:hypothetical protein WR25_09112 [Diploscapter pachys]
MKILFSFFRFDAEPLPNSLAEIAKEEYERFLEKEKRLPKDTVVRNYVQKHLDNFESISRGSLGVRFGLCNALPCFARFKNQDEAYQYLKKNYPKSLKCLGEDVEIQWDTPIGQELVESLTLSENALRFLLLRNLYASEGYNAMAGRGITWATFSAFSCLFTYFLHTSRIGGSTAMSFLVTYAICTCMALYGSQEWNKLYRYITGIHADNVSAKTSFEHCEGGKEYYWKMLKINRIFRDLHPHLYTQIKVTGDVRDIDIPILTRYDHLKDLKEEDDQLKPVLEGDDF